MATYRSQRDRYARPDDDQPRRSRRSSGGPKKYETFIGNVAIVNGSRIRLEETDEPSKWNAGTVRELVKKITALQAETGKAASCFSDGFKEPEERKQAEAKGFYPELLFGIGMQPYIRYTDPKYVSPRRERARAERIID